MSPDDIQKLLGGFATGTLTAEEQEALFDAALNDQELFDALAREQALRDLLRDPASKAQLLAALDEPPVRWYNKLFVAWRPIAMGMAMAAVTTVGIVAVWQSRKPQPAIVSQATLPPASPVSSQPALEDKTARADTAPRAQPAEPESAKRATNEAPAKATDRARPLADENRRAKASTPATLEKSKDLAGALGGARPTFGEPVGPSTLPPVQTSPILKEEQAPLPLTPVPSAMGFRAALAGSGGGGGRGGRAPESDAKRREAGSTNGGVIGGILGGAPGAPAPATSSAAPKAEAAPSQMAKSAPAQAQSEPFAKQSQSATQQSAGYSAPAGQQGAQQPRREADQLGPLRLQMPAPPPVQVTASASSDEVGSIRDARALYYGNAAPATNKPVALDSASNSTASGTVTRKKIAEAPQIKSQARTKSANTIAASVRPAAIQPTLPGVRYSLLRKTAIGQLEAIDAKNALPGETLEVQLTPNRAGTLTVSARSESGDLRVLLNRNVEAMQAYATPALLATDRELRVTLIPTVARAENLKRDEDATAEVTQQSTTEPATYVVGHTSSPRVEFTIPLNHK